MSAEVGGHNLRKRKNKEKSEEDVQPVKFSFLGILFSFYSSSARISDVWNFRDPKSNDHFIYMPEAQSKRFSPPSSQVLESLQNVNRTKRKFEKWAVHQFLCCYYTGWRCRLHLLSIHFYLRLSKHDSYQGPRPSTFDFYIFNGIWPLWGRGFHP